MTDKEIYRIICEENDIPLMAQYRWMEAVSIRKDWDVLIVWRNDDGPREPSNVAAALPYHIFRKYGIKMILMPQLTQITNVYIHPEVESEAVLPLVASRLDKLCKTQRYACCLLQGYFDVLLRESFENKGYFLQQRFSDCIKAITNKEELLGMYKRDRKKNLRRASGLTLINISIEDFYSFHSNSLSESGKKICYSLELLSALYSSLKCSGQAELWGAVNERNELVAAVMTVFDAKRCYYLLATYSRKHSRSGAMTWLTTELILKAGERGQKFDFYGSMVPSIAHANMSYGSIPVTYYRVVKYYNPVVSLLFRLRNKFCASRL